MAKASDLLRRLNESVEAYHASNSKEPITHFNPIGKSTNSFTFGSADVERTGIFFTDNPEFAKSYAPNVFRYTLDIHKIAEMSMSLMLDFAETLDPFGPQRDIWTWAKNLQYFWQAFDNEIGQVFVNWLKQEGYDSATFTEETELESGEYVEGRTYVVFDPAKIRVASIEKSEI